MAESFANTHHILASRLQETFNVPQWMKVLIGVSGIATVGIDYVARSQVRQLDEIKQTEFDRDAAVAGVYRKAYEELRQANVAASAASAQAQARSSVIVNVGNVGMDKGEIVEADVDVESKDMAKSDKDGMVFAHSALSSMPSRYLMEEGNPDLNTDCFSCATAHLAATEGSLRRASDAARKYGRCSDECQKWLQLALEEQEALFARDWTPERVTNFPPEQQVFVAKYEPQIKALMAGILSGDQVEQREAVASAAAFLKESQRFVNAGDSLDHPEVETRLSVAEMNLATAERIDPSAFDDQVATDLRHLRQRVGSKIVDRDSLADVARTATQVSNRLNAPFWQDISSDRLDELANQAKEIRQNFRADRKTYQDSVGSADSFMAVVPPISTRTISESTARIDKDGSSYGFIDPKDGLGVTEPVDIAVMQERVAGKLGEKGVRILPRNLPPSIEAMYVPYTDTILMTPAAMSKGDNFSSQILVHETAHALLHNDQCVPEDMASPEHRLEEEDAELVTIAAMSELGLPIEYHDGTVEPSGRYEINWSKVSEKLGKDRTDNIQWATNWIVRAAQGGNGELKGQTCPHPAIPVLSIR